MSINNILDNYVKDLVQASSIDNKEVIWEEEPVTFQEFLTSKEHLDFPGYSDRQMDVAKFMFGKDPKKIFDNENYLAVLQYGKGGFLKDKVITDAKTGEKHTIEEWIKLGKDIYVYAYDFYNNKKVITKIKPFFKEGHGKIYKVKTKSGKVFYVDAEHKFYTDKFVYQKVKELKPGDKVGKLK